ncbi:MAG: FAD:protein FMN transferase, partial [Planctomycetota bacterium]
MGTFFELVLVGDSESHLRAAGEEALAEIDRLDDQLSAFLPSSEVSAINAGAGRGEIAVEPRLFRLFERAGEIAALTGGAFDPAVAPLLEAWGLRNGRERTIEAARRAAGWRNVRLAGGRGG